MTTKPQQLDLFSNKSLNITYELKRCMRIAASASGLSRDQIVDQMNAIAAREGMRTSVSKAAVDNWLKDSDPGRLPSPPWLTIFCSVTGDRGSIEVMLHPLGCGVVDETGQRLLAWAEAEVERKRAAKRARLALEGLEL